MSLQQFWILWELKNQPVQGNNSVFRLEDVGEIEEAQSFESIAKTNQEYEVVVQYDFIGDYMLSSGLKTATIGDTTSGKEPEALTNGYGISCWSSRLFILSALFCLNLSGKL